MAVNKVTYGDTTLIDLTSDTVASGNLAKGYTAHNASGVTITGTLEYITYYSGTDDPDSSLGSDGDLYFKL